MDLIDLVVTVYSAVSVIDLLVIFCVANAYLIGWCCRLLMSCMVQVLVWLNNLWMHGCMSYFSPGN